MKSYMETKGGLESLKVYERINKKTYLALHCSDCITKALPSMCDLVFKHVKDDNPLWANSRIFILGNFEDRMYNKSQCYTPVEVYSICLLIAKAVCSKRDFNRVTVKMYSAMLIYLMMN